MSTYANAEAAHLTPIELYTFTILGEVYRVTDAEQDVVHPVSGSLFVADPITRGELQQSEEDQSVILEVTVDAEHPVADFFRQPFVRSRTVWVALERMHAETVGEVPVPVFRGLVTQCVFTEAHATLSCVPTRTALSREIPIILVQSLCSNTLYDERCKADPLAHQVAGEITAIAGTVLTVTGLAGYADGYFSGGYIVQGTLPPATVRDHVGDHLFLLYNFDFTAGPVTIYAGCDKKFSTCREKFANNVHYQGFPMMPVIDPFVDAMN